MIRIFTILLLVVSFTYAHKLNVFTNFENDKLFVSAYFASGAGCKNCSVKIYKNDKLLLEDKTNDKGEVYLDIKEDFFNLIVDAGSGHAVSNIIKRNYKINEIDVDKKLEKLLEENKKLKLEVKLLEQKLSYFEIFKILFALFIIIGIFIFLKKIKKD
ncbi:hypothetical protein ACOJTA_09170 [Malaciobacter sp. WC5094]